MEGFFLPCHNYVNKPKLKKPNKNFFFRSILNSNSSLIIYDS